MRLSVIIPCFNAAETLGKQLKALERQAWNAEWEVIACDNGSTDTTRAILSAHAATLPRLRLIDASLRRGAAYARNRGAEEAKGEALAFCDADDEVGEGWVRVVGEALRDHDFIGCAVDTTRLNPQWVNAAYGDHPMSRGLPVIWYPPYLTYTGGGSMGIKKELHFKVGGFDESLLRLEDADYCFRVQQLGVPLAFIADAVVHVRRRAAFRSIFSQGMSWAAYNVLLYKRYRSKGLKDLWRWRQYLDAWRELLSGLPAVKTRSDFGWLIWRLSWQIGALQAALKYRVPPV